MKMNNNKKGFTLIELMMVVAIIGILTVVVLALLNGAKTRTQKTAFKQEVMSYRQKGVLDCTGATSAIPTPSNTLNTTWGAFTDTCSNGDGTFSIPATAPKVPGCKATVNESGITFDVACN